MADVKNLNTCTNVTVYLHTKMTIIFSDLTTLESRAPIPTYGGD